MKYRLTAGGSVLGDTVTTIAHTRDELNHRIDQSIKAALAAIHVATETFPDAIPEGDLIDAGVYVRIEFVAELDDLKKKEKSDADNSR